MTSMNILILYNGTQTYTNTVFDHVSSFGKFSKSRVFYAHLEAGGDVSVDLARFDVVIIHYSIRVCFDHVSIPMAGKLSRFDGLKALFIQDEYDNTQRAWHWIRELGISLVFTVVPPESIARVYPPDHLPGVRFISNITGYVPDGAQDISAVTPPSHRKILIGYRARNLPIRYGALGFEKVEIGRMVKTYCDAKGLPTDIAWTEEARLYGDAWVRFLQSCRAMLGSESGSNVFNWDGKLESEIAQWRKANPGASDDEAYEAVVAPREIHDLMNQVSPRVFEAIANRIVLVLFEGSYSGVVVQDRHYLALKKDGSNLPDILAKLRDDAFVDEITERAYRDVLMSGRFSYRTFVGMVDGEIAAAFAALPARRAQQAPPANDDPTGDAITAAPIRATATFQLDAPVRVAAEFTRFSDRFLPTAIWSSRRVRGAIPAVVKRALAGLIFAVWRVLPEPVKAIVRRALRGPAR